jgi:hypothetical protein
MFDSLSIDSSSSSKKVLQKGNGSLEPPPRSSDLSRVIGLLNAVKNDDRERTGRSEAEWFEDRLASTIILYDFCRSPGTERGIAFSRLCGFILDRMSPYRGSGSEQVRYILKTDSDLILDPDAAFALGLAIDNLVERHGVAVKSLGGSATVGLAIRSSVDGKVTVSLMELSDRGSSLHYGFKTSRLARSLVEDRLGGNLSITDSRLAKAIITVPRKRVAASFRGRSLRA